MSNTNTQTLEFQRLQKQFSAYIRNPEQNPPLDTIEQRRLDIYANLFYKNIENFCSQTFKAFRKVVDDEYWDSLIREFLHVHASKTPYFREIPLEFITFLTAHNKSAETYPFIAELCHYDWVKMELNLAPDSVSSTVRELSTEESKIKLSPLVRLLSYEWPVHEIEKQQSFEQKAPGQPTWLIAYRDRRDSVDVLVSNARTIRMLELLREPLAVGQLEELLASEFGTTSDVLHEPTLKTLKTFARKDIVLVEEEPNQRQVVED